MEGRIGLISVKRAISLVVKASEITDFLRDILLIAISDFEHYLKLKQERFTTSFAYVAIIYLSFFIFLYTAYQLNVSFISSFQKFDVPLGTAGNLTDMFRISILLAAFSGLMAGQLSGNSILSGLKHAIFLLTTAIIMFTVIIAGAIGGVA
jgi:flagellar protein FlaJ